MRKLAIALVTLSALVFVSGFIGCGGEEAPAPMPTPTTTPTPTTFTTFSKYGFSFQYPAGLSVAEAEFAGGIGYTSGSVIVGGENRFFVIWESMDRDTFYFAPDLYLTLEVDGYLSAWEGHPEVLRVERSEWGDTSHAGQPMPFQSYSIEYKSGEPERCAGVAGAFYCEQTERIFVLVTLDCNYDSAAEVAARFYDYETSLVCY